MKTLVIENGKFVRNSSGDLFVEQSPMAIAVVSANVARTIRGECIFDTTRGIPYRETIWMGTPMLRVWEQYLRNAILSIPEVVGIENLTYNVTGDVLTYQTVIRTIDSSEIPLNQEIPNSWLTST